VAIPVAERRGTVGIAVDGGSAAVQVESAISGIMATAQPSTGGMLAVHLSAHCAAQTLLHALQLARLSRPPLTQASVRVANGCKPAELGDHPPPDDGVLGGLGDDFSPRCRHGQNREVPR
jgi:hypothetical protein